MNKKGMKIKLSPGKGAVPDPKDDRDFLVRDLLAAGAIQPISSADWERGYSAYDEVGIKPEPRDQGNRLSCTCEAASMYGRVLRKGLKRDDVTFAASSLYPFIRLPGGGAYIRDAVKGLVAGWLVPKSVLPDEGANGLPISEVMASDKGRITPEVAAAGVKLDVFDNYRMVDGMTDDIDVFAAGIRAGKGALLGFTGTNPGWSCSVCRAPRANESKWGHCVYSAEFGLTDVEACGIKVGTRAVFIPNSWGGVYTYRSGRWAGRQAVPISYFQTNVDTGSGIAYGAYVFNAWIVMDNTVIPPDQVVKDFLKQYEGRIVQQLLDSPSAKADGSMALILDGRFLIVTESRAGLAALTAIGRGMKPGVVSVDKATWDSMQGVNF